VLRVGQRNLATLRELAYFAVEAPEGQEGSPNSGPVGSDQSGVRGSIEGYRKKLEVEAHRQHPDTLGRTAGTKITGKEPERTSTTHECSSQLSQLVVGLQNSVPQWGAESSLAGRWLPAAGGDGAWAARTGSGPMWMIGDIFAAARQWRGRLLTTGHLSSCHPVVDVRDVTRDVTSHYYGARPGAPRAGAWGASLVVVVRAGLEVRAGGRHSVTCRRAAEAGTGRSRGDTRGKGAPSRGVGQAKPKQHARARAGHEWRF
jgi:hypothetical protein